MKELNVYRYPKFIDFWAEQDLTLKEALNLSGYKTIKTPAVGYGYVMISDEELTWFILRWL